jgi:hypothetical protein
MSALRSKASILQCGFHVRYVPEAELCSIDRGYERGEALKGSPSYLGALLVARLFRNTSSFSD